MRVRLVFSVGGERTRSLQCSREKPLNTSANHHVKACLESNSLRPLEHEDDDHCETR